MTATVLGLCWILPAGGADAPLKILEQSVVFRHTGSDTKDPDNTTGFNHAHTSFADRFGREKIRLTDFHVDDVAASRLELGGSRRQFQHMKWLYAGKALRNACRCGRRIEIVIGSHAAIMRQLTRC